MITRVGAVPSLEMGGLGDELVPRGLHEKCSPSSDSQSVPSWAEAALGNAALPSSPPVLHGPQPLCFPADLLLVICRNLDMVPTQLTM